jgi:hypothetical protein
MQECHIAVAMVAIAGMVIAAFGCDFGFGSGG